MTKTKNIANDLIAWRNRNNLTNVQAAAILHLKDVSTYNRWERHYDTGQGGCSLPDLVLHFIELWEKYESDLTY